MGNRAYVIFENEKGTEFSPAVYLHWNGGPESIYPLLDALDKFEVRGGNDLPYQTARFIQIVGNFIGGTLSLGVMPGPRNASELKNFIDENGLYIVYRGPNGRRVKRLQYDGKALSPALVEKERVAAYAHEYSKPKSGKNAIADEILKNNAGHFKKDGEQL